MLLAQSKKVRLPISGASHGSNGVCMQAGMPLHSSSRSLPLRPPATRSRLHVVVYTSFSDHQIYLQSCERLSAGTTRYPKVAQLKWHPPFETSDKRCADPAAHMQKRDGVATHEFHSGDRRVGLFPRMKAAHDRQMCTFAPKLGYEHCSLGPDSKKPEIGWRGDHNWFFRHSTRTSPSQRPGVPCASCSVSG